MQSRGSSSANRNAESAWCTCAENVEAQARLAQADETFTWSYASATAAKFASDCSCSLGWIRVELALSISLRKTLNIGFTSPCAFTRWRQGNHFVGAQGVELTKSHGLEFTRWVVFEAWCDSPGNTGEPKKQTKNRRLTKCMPQVYFQAPSQSSYKLVSYRLVGLEICLTCTYPTFPGKDRNHFSQSPKLRQHPIFTHQWGNPKSFGEENLVPGHGQDFNTLLCTFWNELKIALLWNDWPRRHFVKNVGSYKMIRPTKNMPFTKWHGWPGKFPYKMPPFVRKMPPKWNMGPAIS